MAKPRVGYHDFFAQIPQPLWQALSGEASSNDRTVTAQFIRILRERYPEAVPVEPAPSPAKKRGK
jgi:hypothetical protein